MNLQELKKQLAAAYPYRVELHAHTSPVSVCSQVTPEKMVRVYKDLGYDGVVITNHFTHQQEPKQEYIDRYMKDVEDTHEWGEKLGLKVYLGAEIRFTENVNDYLIFGVDRKLLEEIYDLLPYGVENFRKNYRMPRSVFIQAHPMRNGMEQVDPALLDGIEAFNLHPNHNSRVGMAAVLTKEHPHLIAIAGSDFHHPDLGQEGMSAARFAELPEDTFALAKVLREQNFLMETGRERILML